MPNSKQAARERRRAIESILTRVVLVIVVAIFVFPVFDVFLTSIKSGGDIVDLSKWIFTPVLSNYAVALNPALHFVSYISNSIIISLGSTAISILISFPAAYGISRLKLGGGFYAFWILSMRMTPPIVYVVPMYILFLKFSLLDTLQGLILLYLVLNTSLAVWILKSYIDDLPVQMDEAARLDGASTLRIMTRIILPLSIPGIVTSAMINFIFSWNEFLFAYTLTYQHAVTITAGAARFITSYGVEWGPLAAVGIIAAMPMIIFAFIIQRTFVRGLTLGSVKG